MRLDLHSKRRSRLDEFLTNNNNSSVDCGDSSALARVTHVLCCPACPFMSLQESALAEHAAACSRLDAESGTSVTVHRCCLCLGASTQLDLMREHMAIYHGLCQQGEADLQLTSSRVSCRAAEVAGPTPSGSRKRKSHVPERIHCLSPAPSAAEAAKSPKMFALSVAEGASVKAVDASLQQPSVSASSSSSESPASACDILDLSLKRLADAACDEAAVPTSQQEQQRHRQPQQQGKSAGKPQRQNFSDAQNGQLQRWFSEHRDKPYPSTADTRRLAGLTGLNYSQVKKWFANRRMRTKAPGAPDLLPADGLCGEMPNSDLSSGKASPSNWSVTDFHSENSPA